MANILKTLSFIIVLIVFFSCSDTHPQTELSDIKISEIKNIINGNNFDKNNIIKQQFGFFSNGQDTIGLTLNGEIAAIAIISEPITISQAEQDYRWGYFQFPLLGKTVNGWLVAEWQMKRDDPSDYGDSHGINNMAISKDDGKTWQNTDEYIYAPRERGQIIFEDGSSLCTSEQPSYDIKNFENFPAPVFTEDNKNFYNVDNLPEQFKGVYLNHYNYDGMMETIHAQLHDSNLYRYSTNDFMSNIWWGELKMLNNSTYIAAIYPAYYAKDGKILPSAISIYHSDNRGG